MKVDILDDGSDGTASNSPVAPALSTVVLIGEFSVEAVGKGNETFGICPKGEETACFAGCARSDGAGLKKSDGVLGRVKLGVTGEEVGGCATDDAATDNDNVSFLLLGSHVEELVTKQYVH